MRLDSIAQIGLLVVSAALLGVVGCSLEPSNSTDVNTADENAETSLLDLDGNSFDLWQAGPTKATVVVFTRSDCPVSNRYAPTIRQLYEQFHLQGVDFFLIYVDPREQPDAIRAYLRDFEYPCPALRDPEHSLVARTGATVTPEAVVFDADRKISYRGRIDDLYADLGKARTAPTRHDLADAIEATLAGEPIAEPVTKAVGCNIEDLK